MFSMVCAKLLWFMTSSSIGAGLRMAMISQISFAFSTVSGCCSSAAGFCRTGWQRQRQHQKSHARPARLHVPDHDAVCCPAVHGVQMQHGGCSEEEPTWTSSGRTWSARRCLGSRFCLARALTRACSGPSMQCTDGALRKCHAAEAPNAARSSSARPRGPSPPPATRGYRALRHRKSSLTVWPCQVAHNYQALEQLPMRYTPRMRGMRLCNHAAAGI